MSHPGSNLIPTKDNLIAYINEVRKHYNVSMHELGEQLGLNQSQVSKMLSGNRRLLYEEAHEILTYLTSKQSSIPTGLKVSDYMVPRDQIIWATPSETVTQIAQKMYHHELQQIPVLEDDKYIGVITQSNLLHGFLFPPREHPENWIQEYSELPIKELDLIENIPEYSDTSSLISIFQILMGDYAVMLKKGNKVTGMITRNQLLQLAFQPR